MRTRYGSSSWIGGFSGRRADWPRLRGSHQTSVLIVGAGLTGCATAYALAAAGIRCTLVDAARVAGQGAGHASGIISADAASSYAALEAAHGKRVARAMFEATRRASLDLAATIKRLGLKAHHAPRQALVVPGHGTSDAALRRETTRRRDASLDASWLTRAGLARVSPVDASGALRLRDWAQVDPYRLALGFASAAAARGAVIFERTAVRRVRVSRHGTEVQADGAAITADTVVLCTHEPGALFAPLRRHLRGLERYVVVTEPMPAVMRKAIGSRETLVIDGTAPLSIGWAPDDRIVVSGGDQPRLADRARTRALVQRTGQLMYELLRRYPAISGLMPEAGWHVPLASTADGAIYAGPHRNYPRHLFAWGTGHDPAHAFLASRILLRHVLGVPHREDAFFAFTRG